MIPKVRRDWAVWLTQRGLSLGHTARILDTTVETTKADLARRQRYNPAVPPRTQYGRDPATRPILGHTGTKVRVLRELGHSPARIAHFLLLQPAAVRDFLARLKPLRRGRRQPGRLTRPRSLVEAEAARQAGRRAAAQRRRRQRIAASRAAWGQRGAAAELADWAAARRRAAEPPALLPAAEQPAELLAAPAIAAASVNPWVGRTTPMHGKCKLSDADVLELRRLRAEGWSTGALAQKFGITRASVCNVYLRRTHTHV
jgi:hypothetical protein